MFVTKSGLFFMLKILFLAPIDDKVAIICLMHLLILYEFHTNFESQIFPGEFRTILLRTNLIHICSTCKAVVRPFVGDTMEHTGSPQQLS